MHTEDGNRPHTGQSTPNRMDENEPHLTNKNTKKKKHNRRKKKEEKKKKKKKAHKTNKQQSIETLLRHIKLEMAHSIGQPINMLRQKRAVVQTCSTHRCVCAVYVPRVSKTNNKNIYELNTVRS